MSISTNLFTLVLPEILFHQLFQVHHWSLQVQGDQEVPEGQESRFHHGHPADSHNWEDKKFNVLQNYNVKSIFSAA